MTTIRRNYFNQLEQRDRLIKAQIVLNAKQILDEVLEIEAKVDNIPPLSRMTLEELLERISNEGVFNGKTEQEKAFKAYVKYYGKTTDEIAILCDSKPDQFRQNLSRARKTIKHHIKENGNLWGAG